MISLSVLDVLSGTLRGRLFGLAINREVLIRPAGREPRGLPGTAILQLPDTLFWPNPRAGFHENTRYEVLYGPVRPRPRPGLAWPFGQKWEYLKSRGDLDSSTFDLANELSMDLGSGISHLGSLPLTQSPLLM